MRGEVFESLPPGAARGARPRASRRPRGPRLPLLPGTLLVVLLAFVPGAACLPALAAEEDTSAAPLLLRRLESPDPATRARAIAELETVGEPTWRDAILSGIAARLDDGRVEVRARAAVALGRRGDRRAADALAARLQREIREEVRAPLLLALGDLEAAAHVETIIGFALTAPRPRVRAAAYDALGRIGGDRARETLLEALRAPGLPDDDWSLRSAALLSLARAGRTEDVGRVLVVYREGGGAAHWFARSALARFVAERDPDPLPVLLRMVGDGDPRVAVTAAEGLARSGHPDHLVRLLDHVVPSVRVAAASAVAQAGLSEAYARLRRMARHDRSREVRWAAALALFRAEDPEGDGLVLEGVRSREPAVWAEAVGALARRTGENHGRDADAWRAALLRWRAGR